MRPSTSALAAVGRGIELKRDRLISEWASWINNRLASIEHIKRETIQRQLALIVDILIEMAGAPRRKSTELWLSAAEWYGRTAAERGLAAGEVVEEFQYLRELLIRELSELIATLQPRQSMATVLKLNRLLDKSIAHAVVGYTDTLVETLLNQRGVPVGALDAADTELEKRLKQLTAELDEIRKRQ